MNHRRAATLPIDGAPLNFITVILGLAAAYFLTIQALKVELAAKAEAAAVSALDKKLIGLEVILKQGVVDKEQFHLFSRDIEARLARIEYYLIENTEVNLARP